MSLAAGLTELNMGPKRTIALVDTTFFQKIERHQNQDEAEDKSETGHAEFSQG